MPSSQFPSSTKPSEMSEPSAGLTLDVNFSPEFKPEKANFEKSENFSLNGFAAPSTSSGPLPPDNPETISSGEETNSSEPSTEEQYELKFPLSWRLRSFREVTGPRIHFRFGSGETLEWKEKKTWPEVLHERPE